MTRLDRTLPLLLLIVLSLGLVPSAGHAARPNIVWLLSEDNSVHYAKLYGAKHGDMPNVERLAREGLLFEHAFSNAPVCSVARTTLQTGMYGPRVGTQFHRKTQLAELPDGARFFPAYLRDAGYYTTNNSKKDYNAVEGKVWDESSKNASWRKRPTPGTPFFHMQSFGTSHESSLHFSAKVMESTKTTVDPDAVVLGPHHPDTPTFRYTHARYHDKQKEVDAAIGRVIDQLEKDGLLEDTIVFYFGDHGGVLPRSKGYLYETGLHVPLVVRVGRNVRAGIDREPGTRVKGFVSFVDFGPTVLNLAGVKVPESMDGRPFLGEGVTANEVDARDEAYGYADRFDEKYDLVRSVRKGRFKYIRNYEAHLPDGLQNNYRYKMLAYTEWRNLHRAGELDAARSLFFEPKSAEALYDLEIDPFELNNLAGKPEYAEALAGLRGRLQGWVKGMPDTSFATESILLDEDGLPDAAGFGEEHGELLRGMVDTADLALVPFEEARPKLEAALAERFPGTPYWALTACASFGERAKPLVPLARKLMDDADADDLVRVRAAEFLGSIKAADPRPALLEVLRKSDSYGTASIALNAVVYLRDVKGYEFPPEDLVVKAKGETVSRRLQYLRGEPFAKPKRRSGTK